jgi:hypothetical protein
MTNDKHCDIHHIIHSIINIKDIQLFIQCKKCLLNNTSGLLNNKKTYTISKKKKTEQKTSNKLQIHF